MAQRGITPTQVMQVLREYHTSYLALPRPGQSFRSIVYIGTVGGRDLKVWVRENSVPPFVTSVAWRGEEQ